jgi:DNA-binding transcriptional LysR family regulator
VFFSAAYPVAWSISFLRDQNPTAMVLLKKMRPGAIDLAITSTPVHYRPFTLASIRDDEERVILVVTPPYEQNSPYG